MRLPTHLLDGTGGAIERLTAMVWKENCDIVAAYACGPIASGHPPRTPEVHLAILTTATSRIDDAALARVLSAVLGTEAVRLTRLNNATACEAHQVLSDGRLLFSRHERQRIAFTWSTLLNAFHAEPLAVACEEKVIGTMGAYGRVPQLMLIHELEGCYHILKALADRKLHERCEGPLGAVLLALGHQLNDQSDPDTVEANITLAGALQHYIEQAGLLLLEAAVMFIVLDGLAWIPTRGERANVRRVSLRSKRRTMPPHR